MVCPCHYRYHPVSLAVSLFLSKWHRDPSALLLHRCIAESFVYEYLLQWREGNLLSSMMYHFSWNLCIHLFDINPADNAGNEFPYIFMTLFEVSIVPLLFAHDKRKHMHRLTTK